MEIKTLVAKAHENAVKHGFWEPPLPFGTAIALIHSELSEALEEERNGNPDIWFACNESDNFICTPQDETECLMYGKESLCKYRSRKPEGVAVELADAVIRIADLCGHLGIDLEEVIEIKMAYNEGRPYNTERNSDPEGRKHNESVSTYGAPGTRPRTEMHTTRNSRHVVHPGRRPPLQSRQGRLYQYYRVAPDCRIRREALRQRPARRNRRKHTDPILGR